MTHSTEWGMRSSRDQPTRRPGAGRTSLTSIRPSRGVRSTARNTVTGRGRAQGSGLRAQGGFTLIEVLIVVTLIVVLAGIGLATYTTSITRSKEAVLKEDLFRMRDAIDQYYADKGHYPPTWRRSCPTATCGRFRKIRSPTPPTRGRPSCRTSTPRIRPRRPVCTM